MMPGERARAVRAERALADSLGIPTIGAFSDAGRVVLVVERGTILAPLGIPPGDDSPMLRLLAFDEGSGRFVARIADGVVDSTEDFRRRSLAVRWLTDLYAPADYLHELDDSDGEGA